jgi:DNA-directed RNA polymerase specialized sigma24 family protein
MMSVAYRMLGSVTDAEDAVQDAFVRFQTAEGVTSPEGYLIRTTTRLCIDRLRADRRRKEYEGPWVPEPVDTRTGAQNAALAESPPDDAPPKALPVFSWDTSASIHPRAPGPATSLPLSTSTSASPRSSRMSPVMGCTLESACN